MVRLSLVAGSEGPCHEKPSAGLRSMSGVMGGDPGGRLLGRALSIMIGLAEALKGFTVYRKSKRGEQFSLVI